MSEKIGSLLAQLREYNERLEEMVKERTRELNNALELNKTMMNSVSQGFLMFDKSLSILPVYSRAAEEVLATDLEGAGIMDILASEDKEGNLGEFFDLVFEGMFPFDDLAGEIPSFIETKDGRSVELKYFPVMGENEQLRYIVSIATDKTNELKYMKESREKEALVSMLLKAVDDRQRFAGFIARAKKTISATLERPQEFNAETIFRFAHTLKGNCGYYHMQGSQQICAEFEEHLKTLAVGEWPEEKSIEYLRQLQNSFEDVVGKTHKIIGMSPETMEADLVANRARVGQRIELLKESRKFEAARELELWRDFVPVRNGLEAFKMMSEDIAEKLGKPAPEIELNGPDMMIHQDVWDEISSQMVHLVRNSLDHGIEDPKEREEAGKPPHGKFTFLWGANERNFFVTLKDDGAGINIDALKEKLRELNIDVESADPKETAQFLFEDRVSTKNEVSEISGQGVGLASVRERIRKLGGEVYVDFMSGKGTAFTLSVKLSDQSFERLSEAETA